MKFEDKIEDLDLPDEVVDLLWKQHEQPQEDSFIVNRGSDSVRYGLAKTLYWEINADSSTAILGKTYSFIEDQLRPKDPDKISFDNKFGALYSLNYVVEHEYNLPQRKEKQIKDLIESGLPTDVILKKLPDNGQKYEDKQPDHIDKPLIATHKSISRDEIQRKRKIIWEEDPLGVRSYHVNMKFVSSKKELNLKRVKDEKPITVQQKKAFGENAVLNRFIKYGLHEELSSNVFQNFIFICKNMQKWLDISEDRAREEPEKSNFKQIRYKKHIHQKGYPLINPCKKGRYGRYNVVESTFNKVRDSFMKDIKDEVNNGSTQKAKEMMNLYHNLDALSKIDKTGKGFTTITNWQITEANQDGVSLKRGKSPYEREDAYVTVFRTNLQYLKELHDQGKHIVINYAGADMDDGPIPHQTPEAEEFKIELQKDLKTRVDHIQQSFSKTRMEENNMKKNQILSIRKLLEDMGRKTGLVSYKGSGLLKEQHDLFYGVSKGREFDKNTDVGLIVGVNRMRDHTYALEHYKFYNHFPSSGEYGVPSDKDSGKHYHFPKPMKTMENGTVTGFKDEMLDSIYQYMVFREKRDAFFRLRDQQDLKKLIICFGHLPNEAPFKNVSKYDSISDYLNFTLSKWSLNKDKGSEIKLPAAPGKIDCIDLYRYGKTVKKKLTDEAIIREIKEKGDMTKKELAERFNKSKKSIKNRIEKIDSISVDREPGEPNLYRVDSKKDTSVEIRPPPSNPFSSTH